MFLSRGARLASSGFRPGTRFAGRITSSARDCTPLSAKAARTIATTSMSDDDLAGIRANQGRLMASLHETCAFGPGERWGSAPTETGMHRLTLSDADKEVRDWFVATTEALGCRVTVDAIGSIFAVRPGKREGPATFAGSHLDTQPTGGRYDGILGIQAGVEMLRVLHEQEIETEFPVGVVNWTNEEGARFPVSMMASGVWAEEIGLEHAYSVQEVGGGTATIKDELERIGYLGSTPASYRSMPMGAHFELHIEQGPILEAEQKKIGVVRGVQAYRWYTLEVKGRDAHTGTTPFTSRADALLLASRMIIHAQQEAAARGALASTGILTTLPGSTNTIPGLVRFTLDVRAPLDSTVDDVEAVLRTDFAKLASGEAVAASALPKGLPLTVSWATDTVSPATHFHPDCISAVRSSAVAILGGPGADGAANGTALVRDITSGAGHDSVYASRHCPTSMIFIPCRNGVSHNPTEYSTPEDCALGASVLTQSVLRFDRLRAGQ